MYREFVVPGDEEILDVLGKLPEIDESGSRTLTWQGKEGDSVTLSYDIFCRSVRIRWTDTNWDVLSDVHREGATRLTVSSVPSATHILIEFHMGECTGRMEIQVLPKLCIQGRLLYV